MKTLILLIVIFFWAYICNAQNVNIPDANFKNALIEEGVDTDENGEISYEEAEAVTSLDVSGESICNEDSCWTEGIKSLVGIEAFVNLDTLNCNFNDLGTMDISNLVGLRYLNTGFNCICGGGSNLTELDVSNNTELEVLLCHFNQLTSLDVSNNIYLKILDVGCNNLTSLDISNNVNLEVLDIHFMSDLHEVCVWTMPFPPENVEIETTNSPNVQFTTDCLTNIPDNYKEKRTVYIYPNPATDHITLEFNQVISKTSSLLLFDINGKKVYSEQFKPGIQTQTINLSSFEEGLYLIRISNEQYSYTEKVIKVE